MKITLEKDDGTIQVWENVQHHFLHLMVLEDGINPKESWSWGGAWGYLIGRTYFLLKELERQWLSHQE